MGNYAEERRPLRDEDVPLPRKGIKAGGKDQGDLASRKNEILHTGTIGYVPGHGGTGRGSSAQAGGVDEAPRESARGPIQYGVARPAERPRPMPREIPVQSTPAPGGAGSFVRYLDGHSEIHRERGYLTGLLNNPDVHPDDKRDIQTEITARDSLHNHRFW